MRCADKAEHHSIASTMEPHFCQDSWNRFDFFCVVVSLWLGFPTNRTTADLHPAQAWNHSGALISVKSLTSQGFLQILWNIGPHETRKTVTLCDINEKRGILSWKNSCTVTEVPQGHHQFKRHWRHVGLPCVETLPLADGLRWLRERVSPIHGDSTEG